MTAAQHRRRLLSLGKGRERFRSEAPAAAREAKATGIEVQEIAELLGLKTRKAVYDLMNKGER